MNKMILTFLLCGGIMVTGCKKDPCNPEDYTGYKIEVNLDPNRNYLTAAGQMIGIIKVEVKNANGQAVDASSVSGIGIGFEVSGGGVVKDWEGKDFSDRFAPVGDRHTELQWFMGDNLGANQLKLTLKRKLSMSAKPGYFFCDIPTSKVAAIEYNSKVIRSNTAKDDLRNEKIFIVGDGPEENPNFMQTWLVGNFGIGDQTKAESANSISGQYCYDGEVDNCLMHGVLMDFAEALNRFGSHREQDYVLPTSNQVQELIKYFEEIGYPGHEYYLNNLPFNLDNRRAGYFGYTDPGSSTGAMEYRKLNEIMVFWTGTVNAQDNYYGHAYSYTGKNLLTPINARSNSAFSIRLIEKQSE